MKACHDSAIICLDKKLKEAVEWLVSMHKQMTEARKREIKAIVEAQMKIANLKESFHTELAKCQHADSHARIHWLWNELTSAKRADGYGMNSTRHTIGCVMRDPRTKTEEGSSRQNRPEMRPWLKLNSSAKH